MVCESPAGQEMATSRISDSVPVPKDISQACNVPPPGGGTVSPDAPLIDGLRRGASLQSWMRADAALAPVVGDDGVSRTTTDRMDEWRRLWPKDAAHCATLALLAETVSIELARAAQENARPELARLFIRAIRAHPATPAALVAHIGLTFLDLERLRGGMTRRALFASDDGSAAA